MKVGFFLAHHLCPPFNSCGLLRSLLHTVPNSRFARDYSARAKTCRDGDVSLFIFPLVPFVSSEERVPGCHAADSTPVSRSPRIGFGRTMRGLTQSRQPISTVDYAKQVHNSGVLE